MGMGGQRHAPAAAPPGKWPCTHGIGDGVGPRAGLICLYKVIGIFGYQPPFVDVVKF